MDPIVAWELEDMLNHLKEMVIQEVSRDEIEYEISNLVQMLGIRGLRDSDVTERPWEESSEEYKRVFPHLNPNPSIPT